MALTSTLMLLQAVDAPRDTLTDVSRLCKEIFAQWQSATHRRHHEDMVRVMLAYDRAHIDDPIKFTACWCKLYDFYGGEQMLQDAERRWVVDLWRSDETRSLASVDLDALLLRRRIQSETLCGRRKFVTTANLHVEGLIEVDSLRSCEQKPAVRVDTDRCGLVDIQALLAPSSKPASWDLGRARHSMHRLADRLNRTRGDAFFPWLLQADGCVRKQGGVVCAGGALVATAYGSPVQDWDLFLVSPSSECAAAVVGCVKDCLERVAQHEEKMITIKFKGHVVDFTFCDPDGKEKPEVFQVILRNFPRAEDVVHGFDLHCCALMFVGASCPLFATPAALACLKNSIMVYDPSRLSTTFETRCVKYAQRYGLRLLVPGMSHRVVQELMRDVREAAEVVEKHTRDHIYRFMPFNMSSAVSELKETAMRDNRFVPSTREYVSFHAHAFAVIVYKLFLRKHRARKYKCRRMADIIQDVQLGTLPSNVYDQHNVLALFAEVHVHRLRQRFVALRDNGGTESDYSFVLSAPVLRKLRPFDDKVLDIVTSFRDKTHPLLTGAFNPCAHDPLPDRLVRRLYLR